MYKDGKYRETDKMSDLICENTTFYRNSKENELPS